MPDNLSKIQKMLLGYPVSMVAVFILSWIGKLLNIAYFESIMLIFSVIAIYKIIRENRSNVYAMPGTPILASMLIYSVCIMISFRMFILPSSPPTPEHLGLFYLDSYSIIGMTWTYIRGLPLIFAGFSGLLLGYHMLQSISQAVVFNFTKIDPFNIQFFIEPIFDWFMMVFIIFYGGIKIANFTFRKILIFSLGLFFTTSFFNFGFQSSLFTDPVSFYFGLPVFILFVFYIISYLNKERDLNIIYLTALFIYFAATKAILGIIIPLVLIILFLLKSYFEKTFSYKEILLFFSLGLGALFLKFTIFQHTIQKIYYDYDTTRSLAYQLFKQIYFIKDYVNIVYPVYRFFSSFFRNLPSYMLNWPVLVFSIVFITSKNFKKIVRNNKMPFLLIVIYFLVSISMRCLFASHGGDVYYSYYAQVVFMFLGVFVLDYIFTLNKIYYKRIAILFLIMGAINFILEMYNWNRIGWGKLPNAKGRVWDERATISYDEWLGMEWLKKNTGIYQIFFSDRRYYRHETKGIDLSRFYAYSALSGRQAFAQGEGAEASEDLKAISNERWNLIDNFLSSTAPAEQADLLRKIPADYFIQSLRFNKKDFSKINNLRLVYENRDIKIFKILK